MRANSFQWILRDRSRSACYGNIVSANFPAVEMIADAPALSLRRFDDLMLFGGEFGFGAQKRNLPTKGPPQVQSPIRL